MTEEQINAPSIAEEIGAVRRLQKHQSLRRCAALVDRSHRDRAGRGWHCVLPAKIAS